MTHPAAAPEQPAADAPKSGEQTPAHVEDEAWIAWQTRFANTYDQANYGRPLQAFVMRASHRMVEQAFSQSQHFGRVLEVGAGTGEHLSHVRHSFDEYILSDANPATLEQARSRIGAAHGRAVRYLVQRGERLDYPDSSIDRLIAVHVLEHIPQPHQVLREWRRVLRPGGTLSVLIPTDPGVAWRLARALGPRRHALAQGIAYDYVMAREHINSCNNLVALLRHYFEAPTEQWWPLRLASIDLNLFFCLHATIRK